jgi:hypothetical protein
MDKKLSSYFISDDKLTIEKVRGWLSTYENGMYVDCSEFSEREIVNIVADFYFEYFDEEPNNKDIEYVWDFVRGQTGYVPEGDYDMCDLEWHIFHWVRPIESF